MKKTTKTFLLRMLPTIINNLLIIAILGTWISLSIGKELNPHPKIELLCQPYQDEKYGNTYLIKYRNIGKMGVEDLRMQLSSNEGCGYALDILNTYMWKDVIELYDIKFSKTNSSSGPSWYSQMSFEDYKVSMLIGKDFLPPQMDDYEYFWLLCEQTVKVKMWGKNAEPQNTICIYPKYLK